MNLKEIKERLHLECLERGDDVTVSIFKKNISRNKMQLVSEQYHLLRPHMSTQLAHEGPDRGTMWVIIDQNS